MDPVKDPRPDGNAEPVSESAHRRPEGTAGHRIDTQMKNPTCPVQGCNLAVDIVLNSLDEVLIGAHRRSLEMYTNIAVVSDPVDLAEKADVVHLMLKYTHHNIRQPILDYIGFNSLASLAEAVEKYTIYSAMEVCRLQMTNAVDNYPLEVFCYSVKHNYLALADKAAKLSVDNSVTHFLFYIRQAGLDLRANDISLGWIIYRDKWMQVLVELPTFSINPHSNHVNGSGSVCKAWSSFQFDVILSIDTRLSVLDRFSDIVNIAANKAKLGSCSTCLEHSRRWAVDVSAKIRHIPKFSQVFRSLDT